MMNRPVKRDLVRHLAAFGVEQCRNGISAELRHDVCGRIIDVIGNALAAGVLDTSTMAAQLITGQGGVEQSVAIGLPRRFPMASAAFYNGVLAHSLDFDDTHLPSIVHPSASVIPVALAAAEAKDLAISALLPAIAVGIEITNRLGLAGYDPQLRNSVFFERGLHATSICGTLGAAAAGALLLDANLDGVAHAMAIAASMGAGLLEANRNGGTVKRIHCGWAAHAGLSAAQLALQGLTGPSTVLEGRFGFLQAHCNDRIHYGSITDGLGSTWTLADVGFKPYPCNIYTHAGIDAALELRRRGVGAADIDRVTIGVAAPTLRTIAEPPERKVAPSTGYEAQFSAPYTFATALCGGGGLGVYLDDFTDEAIKDPLRRSLANRITVVAREECSEAFPNRIPAIVDVVTKNQGCIQISIDTNRGCGDSRLSRTELLTKFRLNANYGRDAIDVEGLTEVINHIDCLNTKELMTPLAG